MKVCGHCKRPKEAFELLSDGTPSLCCKGCWREFEERYDRDVNDPAWWEARAAERLARFKKNKSRKKVEELEDHR